MKTIKADIIIIGGGASGLMAAGVACRAFPDKQIFLVEKNKKLGEKLSITGGGRCNITNATFDIKDFLKKYGDAEKFLYSAFDQFSIQDTVDFFNNLGLELTTQAHNRIFPKSEKATDVTRALLQYAMQPNVKIYKDTTVKKINFNIHTQTIDSIETSKGESMSAYSYILATGGLSHPETGSTGDGFNWLKELGHTIKNPTPTLVPWLVSDTWIHKHSGLALDNIKITINLDDKKYFSCVGRVLFTHTGLSGPLILNYSNKLQDALYSGTISGFIDLFPDKNHKELDIYIIEIFEQNKNKKLKNVLSQISSLHSFEFVLQKHIPELDIDTPIHSIKKETRNTLVHLIKKIPIFIRGLEGYDKSIVADGGILLSEIDTRTMQSKKVKNLYITGDLLNIRRPSGGYSLQLCWTTGYVTGIHCMQK
jgi:predicted Rossmann fold flavoprotein